MLGCLTLWLVEPPNVVCSLTNQSVKWLSTLKRHNQMSLTYVFFELKKFKKNTLPDKVLKNPSVWKTKNNFATFFLMRHSLCAPEKKMDDVGGDCRRKKLLIGSFFQSRPRAKKRRHYLLHTDFFCGFKTQFLTEFLLAYFELIIRLILIFQLSFSPKLP